MKKETSNQFTEGLISDLNPLITPNTILTDNLNGTIITYNGNEYTLQNDSGNYELKHCRLKPNYIPVGIKEHGDILYIVSYNPLDKNVEIGSYPSPLMISTPNEENSDSEVKSIIKTQLVDLNKSEEEYTKLMETADSIVFNGENFKLNPGDEYCIQISENNPLYKYETVEYNILDEESNIHNITDLIEIDKNGGDEDFSFIKWTIPGWLMINARLAELSVAGINIRHFYVSNNVVNFSFNLRLNVKDDFLIKEGVLNEWCDKITTNVKLNDIKFRLKIFSKNKTYIEGDYSINDFDSNNSITLKESGWTEWYGDSRVVWKNVSGTIAVDELGELTVQMIPILNENDEYQIVYDNLKQELIFDLKAVDNVDWEVGSDLYQFTSTDTSVKIYTNITGPKVSGAPIDLNYEIYDLNKSLIKSGGFKDYFGIGENILYIDFDEKFKKENIYIIRFKFVSGNNVYNTADRFLITSELLNEFTNKDQFDRDINFDEWVSKYWNRVPEVDLDENDFNLDSKESIDWESPKTDRDIIYFEGQKYNTFHPYPDSGLSELRKLKKGYKYNYSLDKDVKPNALYGDLWTSLNPDIQLQYKDGCTEEMVNLDKTVNVYKYLEKELRYSEYGTPFEFGNMSIKTFDKESEYRCDLNITLVGKDEVSKRDFEYSGKFKRGDIVESEIPYTMVDDNNSDSNIHDISGIIQTFLIEKNLSFIKVNVNFKETNNLRKWNLSNRYLSEHTWAGYWDISLHTSMGNYIFNGLDNSSRTLTFIAFRTYYEASPEIGSGSSYPPIGHVTLLPITNNQTSDELYLNFVKNLFYITEDTTLTPYIRYVLQNTSWNDSLATLDLYQSGKFLNNEYSKINILDVETKKNFVINWGNLKYTNIFVNGNKFDSNPQKVITVNFNLELNKEIYPYKNTESKISIYDLDLDLKKLTMSIESDYNTWDKYFEQVSQRKETKGVYCNHVSSSDSIIRDLTNNYRNNSLMNLTPWIWTELSAIGIDEMKICWVAGRTSNRDIKEQSLGDSGKIIYGAVFKQSDLILEDKWPWLRDEI